MCISMAVLVRSISLTVTPSAKRSKHCNSNNTYTITGLQVASIKSLDFCLSTWPIITREISGIMLCKNSVSACTCGTIVM